jgi:hypothetical protein
VDHAPHTRQMINAYNGLFGKREGMIPAARPRPRWEDNIKMDLNERGCGQVSICLGQSFSPAPCS